MCKIVFFLLSLAIISILENDGVYVTIENGTDTVDNRLLSMPNNFSSLAKDYNKTTKNRFKRTLVLFVPENDESKYQDTSAEDPDFQNHKTKRCKSNAVLHKVKHSLPSKDKEGINSKILVQRDIMLPNTENIEDESVEVRPNVKLVSLKELKTPSRSILARKSLRKDSSEDNTALVEALKGSLKVGDYEKTSSNRRERKEGCNKKNYVCYCREENCQGKKLKKEPPDAPQIPYVKQSLQLRKDKPNRKNQRLITNDESRLRNAYKSVNRPKDILAEQNIPITQPRSKILPNLLPPVGAAPTLSESLQQNLNNYHILPVYQHIPAGFAIPVTSKDPNGGLSLKVGLPLEQYGEILQQHGNSDEDSCDSYENSSSAENDVVGANRDDSLREDVNSRYLGKTSKTRPDRPSNYLNFEDCIKMYGREFCVISGTYATPTSLPRDSDEASESTEDCSDDFPHPFNHDRKNPLEENRNVQTTRKNDQYTTKNLPDYSTYVNPMFATIEPSVVGVTSGMENVGKSNLGIHATQNFGKSSESSTGDDDLASYTDYDPNQTTPFYDFNEQNMKIGSKNNPKKGSKNGEKVGQIQRYPSPTGTLSNYPHYTKPFLYTTLRPNTNDEQLATELSTVDGRTKTYSQASGNLQTSLAKQSIDDYLTSTGQDSSKAQAMTIKYKTFHKSDGGRDDVTNVDYNTDSSLGNALNINTADSEIYTTAAEYFSTSFANDGMDFTAPSSTELEMFETSTDTIGSMDTNNVATEISDDFDMVTETPIAISTIVKETAIDATVAQPTKSPTLGKSKVYVAERKEFNPNAFDDLKYTVQNTSESTQSQPVTLNEENETSTIVGVTYLNSQKNYSDKSSTFDYNTDLVSNTGTTDKTSADQLRIFTDSTAITTNLDELHTDSSKKVGQYSAFSMVPTTYNAEEISEVTTISSDGTSTEDSFIGTMLVTDKTDEKANEFYSDMPITTSSTGIIGISFNTTEDYLDGSSREESSWAETNIFKDQSDVTEAYTITSENTEGIVGITSTTGDGIEQDEDISVSQNEHTTESLIASTNVQNNSLPFCDNTLLLNAVKMVLNDYASNKSTNLDEYVNRPLDDLRTRTESLSPEILGVPNLKEFLLEPRVENMVLGNIQTFLSRITGIHENIFASQGVRKVVQDTLRNVGLMIPGLQDQNKLPPMTVEEHQFKGEKWASNIATLVPGIDEQTDKPNMSDKLKNVVRELLDHPAVGAAKDLKPTLKNIILATAKNTMEKGKNDANGTEIDNLTIHNILEDILLHEHPIDIEEIQTDDQPSSKNVEMVAASTDYPSLPTLGTMDENIATEFSKAVTSNEEVSVTYNNDKEQFLNSRNPYQKATSFTTIPIKLTTVRDSISSEESVEKVNENSSEELPSTEYYEVNDNITTMDYALLGESDENPIASSADLKYDLVSTPKGIENLVSLQPTTTPYVVDNIQNQEETQINDENEQGLLGGSPDKLPTEYYSPKDRILNYIKNHQTTPEIEVGQVSDGTVDSSEDEQSITKHMSQIPKNIISGESIEKSAVIVGKSSATQAIIESTSDYDTTISGLSNVPSNTGDNYESGSNSYSESPTRLTSTNGEEAICDNNDDLPTVIDWSSTEKPTSTVLTNSESSSEDYKFKLTTPDLYEFVGATASEKTLQPDLNIAGESNEHEIDGNKSYEVESEEISLPVYKSTVKTHEITTETRKTVTKTTIYRGLKNAFTENPLGSQQQNIYYKNKTMENEETGSTWEAPGYTESEEVSMYLGKIIPNASENSAQDVSGLLNSNLYYIGDGVKLPLEIKKLKDGSYGLSISEKICQRVMKKKCPCCIPLEGNIVRTSEENTDVENNIRKLIKKSNYPGMQTKVSRNARDGKRQSNQRLKRSSRSNLKESETTSMPVIDFARKYNLSLNLDEEKIINSGENTTNIELQADNSVTRKFLPLNSNINKRDNFGQSTTTTNANYLNTTKEIVKVSHKKNNVHTRKFNIRNKAEKKQRRAQYRYQRNVDENARKRTKTLKSILFWLKDLIIPDNSNPLT